MDDFEASVVALLPSLRRYARKLSRGHREVAEDLVQDCVLRALSKRDRFVPGTDLRAWMFAIMHNDNVNRIRRGDRRPECAISEALGVTAADDPQMRTLVGEVEAALRRLPSETSRVVIMIGQGHDYQHVAEIEGTPIGTVRSRLSRGRATLRLMVNG